ncbi:acyltransferase family protein [Pseudomonas guariconensis]|uniref:acyltransferase family protein n=1 Tax=Pseudomonas guariconensis TaxID=1288410 RepID=UPI00387278C7
MRNASFDIVKASLILLVVAGHIALGTLDENLLRKVIYFFHMPLFIAITGYFVSSNLLAKSTADVLGKYWWRMILPYLLAFSVYSALVALLYFRDGTWLLVIGEGRLSFWQSLFLYPYYHLWFVPAVIVYVLVTKFLWHEKWNWLLLFAFFVLAVIYTFDPDYLASFSQLDYLGDKRFYCYYFYFAFGYFLNSKRYAFSLRIPVMSLILALLIFFYTENRWLSALLEVSANCAIIFIVLRVCQVKSFSSRSLFAQLGRVTLPIYLWHVLPILVAKKAILQYGDFAYYMFTIVFTVVLIFVLLWLEKKSRFIDLLIYGSRTAQTR